MPGFGNPSDQDPPADLDWDMMLGPAPLRRYNPNRGIYHFDGSGIIRRPDDQSGAAFA
jgi:hypothetical protein